MKSIVFFLACLCSVQLAHAISGPELEKIGHRVWQNECDGTISGLTSWNSGENFASLGIGHFIWTPRGVSIPFEESFPKLVQFLKDRGVEVPAWVNGPCPWNSRAEFQNNLQSPRMKALRGLLANTIPQQAAFLAERMRESLSKMLAATNKGAVVRANFERLSATGPGTYALIDYVNFKGEGTLPTERYHGEGWGLLQVLEGMDAHSSDATAAFAASAARVLKRRVHNAPPERHEERWLPGWLNRVERYGA